MTKNPKTSEIFRESYSFSIENLRMKFLIVFFILLSFPALTQKSPHIIIDSIPKKGFLLDRGWKYKKGDNLDWAKKNYDDNDWPEIDPTKEISELPEIFDNDIKWLRLQLNVRNQLKSPVGIAINQAGASEIYLNGKLVHTYGIFDFDPNKVIAYDPIEIPIHLPIDTIGSFTLAIRYRLQPKVRYTIIYGLNKNSFFKATLVDLVSTLHLQRSFNTYYKGLDIFIVGALLMLFIFHLALFLYHRENKTMIYLAMYLFSACILRAFKIMGQSEHFVYDRFFILNLSNALIAVVIILLTIVVYRMAKVRYDKYFYFLTGYEIIYAIVSITTYGKPYQTLMLLVGSILSFFVLLRLVIKGYNKVIKGFTILGIFISFNIIALMLLALVILSFNYGISPTGHNDLTISLSPYWVDIIFTLGSIAVPIGLSLMMGIENRETNRELRSQIILNEQLKDQAIQQEIEKQHILENQNEILETQVTERTAELHHSLETLKSTQAQLIQSEKMASLGELTAGIAHEIQNPLNFVNNFSELSVDLVKDLKDEIDKPEIDKEYVEELMGDLSQNQVKINHHGKRASDIVRSMLEHSRTSSGQKEPTDINALCDEYLRLAYHGLRAKDKTFNAAMETHFESNLPRIEVVAQDIGRVILNLISNAFYAVNERNKKGEKGYQPKVTVTSRLTANSQMLIAIKDNGSGIPDHIKEKIFQPFFTTKPTGQGTGLGLSLSYDIVKAHGGELRVESNEGGGTTFTIQLPFV